MIDYFRKLKHAADSRYGHLSRFVQFCFVGASGMLVDLSLYALLLIYVSAIPKPASRAIAIWIAMTWNFYINRRVTFSYSRDENPFFQYGKYVLACMLGAVVSWAVSMGLGYFNEFFARHDLTSAFIGIVAGTICNFMTSLLWVFNKE
jgi:dolichol-phosphate mannosyltransferase